MSQQDVHNGKLTSSQETACKEGNVRGVFGYPTKIEELAKKYRKNPNEIDNILCQFGSMENFIKEYRETGSTLIGMNLVINISSETQSKGMNLLCQEIYDHWTRSDSNKRYLVLVDGEKLLEALKEIKENQAEVLRYRYGLIDGKRYTLDEIAEKLSVDRETLRNRERTGILRLRNYIKKDTSSILYSERDTEEQNFTPEEAERRKLLLDRIYNSNLVWVPNQEYEQEPDSLQPSELREIAAELKSIQPIIKEKQKEQGTSINTLGLSTRAYKILTRAGITTIEQLSVTSTDELMAVRLAGTKSIEEIDAKLKELGIERTPSESTTIVDTPISFDSTTTIDVLGLSVRAYNALTKARITTIGQLSTTSTEELMNLRNAGRKTVEEIIAKLKELGIERTADVDTPTKENTELEKLKAKRDELAREVETLKQQTKSAEQLLASYDALLNGNTQKDGEIPDLEGE